MGMRIPSKGEYSYHVKVGLERKCRRLENENAALRSDEALEKERADAGKWRRRHEREAAARKKDAMVAA